MLPVGHLVFGIIFAIILLAIFPEFGILGFVIIIFSAVLIDVDHYVYYVFKKNNRGIVKAYKWYKEHMIKIHHLSRKQKKNIYFGFFFFHGVEILLIIYLLYIYISQLFLYILIGFSFHLLSDLTFEIIDCGKTEKISVIYNFFKAKKLKFIDNVKFPLVI